MSKQFEEFWFGTGNWVRIREKQNIFYFKFELSKSSLPVDDLVKVRNETLSNEGSYKHIPSVD